MKVFAIVLLVAAVAYAAESDKTAPASARSYGGGSSGGSSYGSAPAPSYGGSSSSSSYGGSSGSSYGGSSGSVSIPAPPCPRNYILSCQPSLQAAPCSPSSGGGSYGSTGGSSGGYGSAGAYSFNYPSYIVPQWNAINGLN